MPIVEVGPDRVQVGVHQGLDERARLSVRHGRRDYGVSSPPVTSSTVSSTAPSSRSRSASCPARPGSTWPPTWVGSRTPGRRATGQLDLRQRSGSSGRPAAVGVWTPCDGLGRGAVGLTAAGVARRRRAGVVRGSPARCRSGRCCAAPRRGATCRSEALLAPAAADRRLSTRSACRAARRRGAAGPGVRRRAARSSGRPALALSGLSAGGLPPHVRGDARADAGDDDRRGDGHGLRPRGGHRLGDRHHLLAPGEEARAQEAGERQERGDALDGAARRRARQRRDVEPDGHGQAAARLAVGDVAREAARSRVPERRARRRRR